MECLRLRVKDVNFGQGEMLVREGKGDKDRGTMLPAAAVPRLGAHLERVRTLHAADLAAGGGCVMLPDALARKYQQAAARESERPSDRRGQGRGSLRLRRRNKELQLPQGIFQ